jgi:hypothetical protein
MIFDLVLALLLLAPCPFIEQASAPKCDARHAHSSYTDDDGTDWACDGLLWRTK